MKNTLQYGTLGAKDLCVQEMDEKHSLTVPGCGGLLTGERVFLAD